jgi:3-oxoadipate enol-lactonase
LPERKDERTASGSAQVNGATLYYEAQGEGDTLVFVHCAPGDSTLWDPQFGTFTPTHYVVRYDARGFGRSSFLPGHFAFHEDLRGLLDVLRIDRATVVGLSLGGRTAIDLALSHPERVRALVLANSGVSGSALVPQPPGLSEVDAALTRGEIADAAELMTRIWFDGPRVPAAVDPTLRAWFLGRTRDRFERLQQFGQGRATHLDLDPPAVGRLNEIRCPTLILTSDLDQPAILDLGSRLAASIAGAQAVRIQGAAHIVNLERPQEFNAELASFLNRLAAA